MSDALLSVERYTYRSGPLVTIKSSNLSTLAPSMKITSVSIFAITLVLMSGIPLISGCTTNYASARYANTQKRKRMITIVTLVPTVPLISHKLKGMEALVHLRTYRFLSSRRMRMYLQIHQHQTSSVNTVLSNALQKPRYRNS